MANTRRYHPQVVDDLSRATSYYDAISTELGNRFRQSVRSCLHDLTQRPNSYGKIDGSIRAAMTNAFPYVVLFDYSEPVVTVLAIHHAATDPANWTRRRT